MKLALNKENRQIHEASLGDIDIKNQADDESSMSEEANNLDIAYDDGQTQLGNMNEGPFMKFDRPVPTTLVMKKPGDTLVKSKNFIHFQESVQKLPVFEQLSLVFNSFSSTSKKVPESGLTHSKLKGKDVDPLNNGNLQDSQKINQIQDQKRIADNDVVDQSKALNAQSDLLNNSNGSND